MLVFDNGQQKVSYAAHGCKGGNYDPPLSVSIARKSYRNTKQKASEVHGCGQALRINARIPHALEDRGQEIRQSGERIIAAEVDQHVNDIAIIQDSCQKLGPIDLALRRPIHVL